MYRKNPFDGKNALACCNLLNFAVEIADLSAVSNDLLNFGFRFFADSH
jgi:hypothetical protein